MGELIQFGDISKRKLVDNSAVYGSFVQVMFYANKLDVMHQVCEKYKPKDDEYTVNCIAFGALSEAIEDIISEETSESFLAAPEVPMCTHILGMHVEEKNRAWTSSSSANDNKAVTIEVADDEIGGNWHVSDRLLQS